MSKTRRGFDDALVVTSLFGFLAIALNSFTEFDLSPWSTAVFMLIAGVALMIEGRIFTIRDWGKDGIQPPEVPFIFTIVFGVFTVVVGMLALPVIDLVGPKLSVIVGVVAILCIVFISLQRWVFD